jgi:hypothetical protein
MKTMMMMAVVIGILGGSIDGAYAQEGGRKMKKLPRVSVMTGSDEAIQENLNYFRQKNKPAVESEFAAEESAPAAYESAPAAGIQLAAPIVVEASKN